MLERYDPAAFEGKWRARWNEADLFRTKEEEGRPKFYGLDFFPYPSGAGLSVGHCRNYIPTDVLCRMKIMQGFNVLHPMGFDAFGLPAENEAIKKKRNPAEMIAEYADNYRRQMELIGISYDWSRSFKSCDPEYYRWTQWIFKLLYDRGLAYRKQVAVNWDPVDKTVLADEEVIGGRAERSGALVEKKLIPQWMFKITAYADRLVDDLDDIDWPEGIKNQQRNWIGRSKGVEFEMSIVVPPEEVVALDPSDADFEDRLADLRAMASKGLELAEGTEWFQKAKALAKAAEALDPTSDDFEDQLETIEELADDLEDWAKAQGFKEVKGLYDDIGDEAEDLLDDLEDLEDEEDEDDFELVTEPNTPAFRVFTTRIDTIYGMTFCVLAPEHPQVEWIKSQVSQERREAIETYQKEAKEKSDEDRTGGDDKTGVYTGAFAVNPANGRLTPIFIADYVLMGYGTGAIMAVPAHDQRDFDFAITHGLDIIPVCQPDDEYLAKVCPLQPFERETALAWYVEHIRECSPVFFSKESALFNSGVYSGRDSKEASEELATWLEGIEKGERKTNYKLRDWLISRQRYWGCPIPISYDKDGEAETLMDQALPVTLPDVESYEPSDDGASPLSRIEEFVNTTLRDGTLGTRETDTMSGFACSSWYFLRFCDPFNSEQPWSLEAAKRWMPVDCYVGGAEHAVMHLLYARFWTKFLYDEGLCPVKEPFGRLMNQGQVLAMTPYRAPREDETLGVGEDGILISFEEARALPENELTWRWARMSKSKGNVVTPDEAVAEYGADALRVYELFVAPFEANIQWSNEGMQGACRFLDRVIRLAGQLSSHYEPNWKAEIGGESETPVSRSIRRIVHKTLLKATEDIERFAFNTYISSLMVLVNELNDLVKQVQAGSMAERWAASEAVEALVLALSPAAPHTADELWEGLGRKGFTLEQSWPKASPDLAKDDLITIAVQVNGKLRDTLEVAADTDGEALKALAQDSGKVKVFTDGKEVKKVILVPGKLVNIVVG
jgi:leucyl-tRNA synthetase